MRILISITVMISDYKIKIKNIILIETFNKIFDKNHMNSDDSSNKIIVNQKTVFSLKNMIIAEKIIFVLIIIIQIIQLRTANTYSIQIKHLQKKIKSNHSLLEHD